MEILLIWGVASLIVAVIGQNTTWGFWGIFAASLLLSPVIGFILALALPNKIHQAQHQRLMAMQQQQLVNMANKPASAADELKKLSALKEAGTITEEEYNTARQKWAAQL